MKHTLSLIASLLLLTSCGKKMPENFSGVITAVDSINSTITITNNEGKTTTVPVPDSEQWAIGYEADIEYNNDGQTSVVKQEPPFQIQELDDLASRLALEVDWPESVEQIDTADLMSLYGWDLNGVDEAIGLMSMDVSDPTMLWVTQGESSPVLSALIEYIDASKYTMSETDNSLSLEAWHCFYSTKDDHTIVFIGTSGLRSETMNVIENEMDRVTNNISWNFADPVPQDAIEEMIANGLSFEE